MKPFSPMLNEQAIERIVHEVVRRVREAASRGAAIAAASTPASIESNDKKQADDAGSVAIDDRVVTLASLKERWTGMRRLQVRANAVVTPAVRDELRERKIELTIGETIEAAPQCVLACRDDAPVVAALRRYSGARLQLLATADEVFQQASENVRAGQSATVAISRPALALCELNKHAHVRAIQANSLEALREACEQVAANVLILDPRPLNPHQIAQQLETFAKA